jgi:hypothetical protein
MPLFPESELPCPRLELRWVDQEPDEGGYTVVCEYSYVFPIAHLDCRAEGENADGEWAHGVRREHRASIGKTRSTRTATDRIRGDEIDTPFRDGSHIHWDRPHFGNPPMFAVACGQAMRIEPRPDTRDAGFIDGRESR